MGNPEYLRKLEKLYGEQSVERDAFGKRPATGAEVKRVLGDIEFGHDAIDRHLPTEQDLSEKKGRNYSR